MNKLTIIAYVGAEYQLTPLVESLRNQAEEVFERLSEIQLILVDSVGEKTTRQTIEHLLK